MSAGVSAPPTIPSVEVGTPPKEWSESVLASSPTEDTPATSSEIPGKVGDPKIADEQPREESQVLRELEKHQAQPRGESKPTRGQPPMGATVVQTAKQYVPQQVEKTFEYATQAAAAAVSYLPIPQDIKDTVASYLCELPPCETSV